jgi:uncharacterized membrane-anchored protein YhcB (DUF1043 family)
LILALRLQKKQLKMNNKFKKDDDKTPLNFNQYRKEKAKKEMENKIYRDLEKVSKHSQLSAQNFLEAWKEGIKLVGTEFFNIKSDTVDSATEKWLLAPNLEFIQKASPSYSHGKQVLLALMYSFYDSQEGQELLERCNTPNLVDALGVLDFEGREIIAKLWLNYAGW